MTKESSQVFVTGYLSVIKESSGVSESSVVLESSEVLVRGMEVRDVILL